MEGLGPFALGRVGPMWDPPGRPDRVRSPFCPSLAGLRPTSQALRASGQGLPPASQVSRQVLRRRQPFLCEGTCGGQGLYVTSILVGDIHGSPVMVACDRGPVLTPVCCWLWMGRHQPFQEN